MSSRRAFLTGIGSAVIAAPAIVRSASLMPIRGIVMPADELYGVGPVMHALDWYPCMPYRMGDVVRSEWLGFNWIVATDSSSSPNKP